MLRKISKDTFSTIIGCVGGLALGATMGALTAVSQGQFSKEALIAGAASGAIPVVAGYLHNKGKTEPVK